MSDSSDEERRVSSSDSSSDDEILSAPTIGNRIKRERKATERFEAGPATGRAAGAGEAKYSPGGTKQTNLNDLLREKQRKDRRKRDLAAGERLDGEGGYTVSGGVRTAATSVAGGYLPLGLAHNVTLTRDVAEGQPVTWEDIRIDDATDAYRLRKEVERLVGRGAVS